ncbi:pyocin activator PrtN family protein [Ectopseudomonas khazarica]|uniref:pyocin activator PrtN family protein n=1 Tax=Ectopseudomonas khazarica TaxID=2502979 RepID=UPI001AEF9D06|nr:pyocin activator PrtN family protein [Pseudomonas khazarica]QTS88275.1 pyocin activator PrtN family protein [Pseudomonas khazarica]
MSQANQRELRLLTAPRAQTVELLFRVFGDLLVPVERLRAQYFDKLNDDNFTRALRELRVPLPVTKLDASAKGTKFVDIRHLAVLIDTQAEAADAELAEKIRPAEQEE